MYPKSQRRPLTIIAGPCVIESEQLVLDVASELKSITASLDVRFFFKASFDKANRSSLKSFRGPGMKEGLSILEKVKSKVGVPVLTDVHELSQVEPTANTVDAVQIPAFLCRQTDLIVSAAQWCQKKQRHLNIKKGQFLAPWDSEHIINKVRATLGQETGFLENVSLTERGTSFGYNALIVDMAGIQVMQNYDVDVYYDATHSVQTPASHGGVTGGRRDIIETLSQSAIAAGANGIFLECHPEPKNAKSDAANAIRLSEVGAFLKKIVGLSNYCATFEKTLELSPR